MRENSIHALSLHLRRIHFWITVTTIGFIIVIFGYTDPTIRAAIDEMENLYRISEHWDPDKPDKKDVFNVQSFRAKLFLIMTSQDGKYDPSIFVPQLALTTADTLSNCGRYREIELVGYAEYSEGLKTENTDYIRCLWIGENQLIGFPVRFRNQPKWYSLKVHTTQSDNRIERKEVQPPSPQDQKEMPVAVASNVKSLNQCSKWMDVQRNDFDEFTKFLEEKMKIDSPVLCSWEGENELLIANVQTEWTGDTYLVTDGGEIMQIHIPSDLELTAIMKEWPDLKHHFGQEYSKIIPTLNNLIMPHLHHLEKEGKLNLQHPIDKNLIRLRRQLVPLEQINSSLHVPLTPEILFIGGPCLLILLQCYFLTHYRQLIYLLQQIEDGLPHSPWIGIYRDPLSLLMLSLTLLFMPPAVVVLLWCSEIVVSLHFTRATALISIMISTYQAFLIRRQRSILHKSAIC